MSHTKTNRVVLDKATSFVRTQTDHLGLSRGNDRRMVRMDSRGVKSQDLTWKGRNNSRTKSASDGTSSFASYETLNENGVSFFLDQAAEAHNRLMQVLRQENSNLRLQMDASSPGPIVPLRKSALGRHEMAHDDKRAVPCEAKLEKPLSSIVAVSRLSGLDDADAERTGDCSDSVAAQVSATPLSLDVMRGDERESEHQAQHVRLDMPAGFSISPGGVERMSYAHRSNSSGTDHTATSAWQHVELRSVWLEAQEVLSAGNMCVGKSKAWTKERASKWSRLSSDEESSCIIVHPASARKYAWDSMAMLAMMFDIITLPLILAFHVFQDDDAFAGLVWFTRIFWSMDILTSFLTGYYTRDEQRVIMDPRTIAVNYVRTWLAFDLGIVCIDWFIFLQGLGDEKTYAKASRMNRLFRGLRLLRTLRFLKVMKYKRFIEDLASSEVAYANLNVLRLVCVIIIVSHIIACFWFWIGSWDDDGWVTMYDWVQDSTEFKYTTSYHWAVMHLGVGEVQIDPQTTLERCASILVVLCGIVFFSCLVSSATNSMAQLQTNQAEHRRQHAQLTNFCRQNRVPRELLNRITRFLQYEMMELNKQRIDHRDVSLLDMLSGPLYTELLHCMYSPILQKHTVFNMLCRTWPLVAQKISSQVVLSKYLGTSDMLFDQGEEAKNVFWVMSGQMEYSRDCWPSWKVQEEDWISEPALWTLWLYQGSLQAIGPCRLIEIDVDQFVEVILSVPGTWQQITQYAESFVDYLNNHVSDFCFDVNHDHCSEVFGGAKRSYGKFERFSESNPFSWMQAVASP